MCFAQPGEPPCPVVRWPKSVIGVDEDAINRNDRPGGPLNEPAGLPAGLLVLGSRDVLGGELAQDVCPVRE